MTAPEAQASTDEPPELPIEVRSILVERFASTSMWIATISRFGGKRITGSGATMLDAVEAADKAFALDQANPSP